MAREATSMQQYHDCKTCKYYMEHFVIFKNIYLMDIGGHCVNDDLLRLHPQKPYQLYENCEYREETDRAKEIEPDVMQYLRQIQSELYNIAQILRYYHNRPEK